MEMRNVPMANETVDFNSYTYQNTFFVLNPASNTFVNAPTAMLYTFSFSNVVAFDGGTSLQTIIIPAANITYTREYVQDVGFGAWKSNSGGGGGSVNSVSGINGNLVLVNNTDPTNPVVSLASSGTLPAFNGSALTSLTKTQVGLNNVQNVDQTNASNLLSGTVTDNLLSVNVTKQGNTFNNANQLIQFNANKQYPNGDIGTNGQVNAGSAYQGALNTVLTNIVSSIPAPYTLPTASTTVLGGVKVDGSSITITNGVISAPGGGSGSVTTVSVVTANGFGGTVATSTTTPAITINTNVSGVLKGNGTAISAAVAGTDYVLPSGNITGTAANVTGTVAIANGGTGATTNTQARTNLGLGTISTQNANAVAITGGSAALANGSVVAAPVNANDIANKAYVDNVVGGGNVTRIDVRAMGGNNFQANGAFQYTDANSNIYYMPACNIYDNVSATFPVVVNLASGAAVNVKLDFTIANNTASQVTLTGLNFTLSQLTTTYQGSTIASLASQTLTIPASSLQQYTITFPAATTTAITKNLIIGISGGSGGGTSPNVKVAFVNQFNITVA